LLQQGCMTTASQRASGRRRVAQNPRQGLVQEQEKQPEQGKPRVPHGRVEPREQRGAPDPRAKEQAVEEARNAPPEHERR
jgi:hypothetical protein